MGGVVAAAAPPAKSAPIAGKPGLAESNAKIASAIAADEAALIESMQGKRMEVAITNFA